MQNRPMAALACTGAAFILLAATLIGYFIDGSHGPSFDNLQQACSLLRTAGYFCTSDRADGRIENSFVVCREPLTWEEGNLNCKSGPMGRRWKGRVWIIRSMPFTEMWTTPGDTEPRIWGKVWAFGDSELLAEIERLTFK